MGVYIYYGNNGVLLGNTIADNGDDGLQVQDSSNYRLDNNLLVGNGGMVRSGTGLGSLRHNTIADNRGGAGLRLSQSSVRSTNTILSGQTYGIRTLDTGSSVQAAYTLWYSNTANTAAKGGVNIRTDHSFSGDPCFVGGTEPFAAYHLQADSPAIDVAVDADVRDDIDEEGRGMDTADRCR